MSETNSKYPYTADDPRKITVALVDDVKSISSAMKRELMHAFRSNETIRVQITDFQDSTDALDRITENPPDLLITDIKMPYLTGDKLVDAVKKVHPKLPIIVVTGFATKENILSVYKSDKDIVILSKPWNPQRLVQAVSQLLDVTLEYKE